MINKRLLVDCIPFEISSDQINESLSKNGKLIVRGVLQRAESKNHNNRVYPIKTLMREAGKYANTFIKERRALGELDHPESSVVNLNNVSHNVLDMGWSGNDLIGTVEVLGTPAGNILKELFKSGIKLGISSRGLGSVKEINEEGEGTLEVQPDFELIAFDFVSNPSTQGAFMSISSVNESVQKKINDKCSNINKIITDILSGS
jgi:hypothetical protein